MENLHICRNAQYVSDYGNNHGEGKRLMRFELSKMAYRLNSHNFTLLSKKAAIPAIDPTHGSIVLVDHIVTPW